TAGLDTVAVRMPAHPVALRLIECSGCPIAAPSANRFGHISPTQARDVLSDLGKAVDLILDGGRTVVGIESTVLLVTNQGINLLRPGGISTEDIERKVGSIKIITHSPKILSPGATKIHYSPRVPLYIFNGSPQELERINEPHLVIMSPIPLSHQSMKVFPLSQDGNLSEIASHLFEEMRTLERMRVCAIIALPVEKKGLGRAIMDRLTRASTGTVMIEGDALVFIDR
ncbi:MAG: L-threonylcarbamoyladenylate synthase, partial [Atribacterota bacterium]